MHLRTMFPGESCTCCGCIAWGGEKWYDGAFGVKCADKWEQDWNDTTMDQEMSMTKRDAVRWYFSFKTEEEVDDKLRILSPTKLSEIYLDYLDYLDNQ